MCAITRCVQLQRAKGKTTGRPTISALKKSHKYHRSAIDLPTAEPYLECTSDCEDYNESRLTSSKNSFRMQLKSGHRASAIEKSSSTELVVLASQKSDFEVEPDKAKAIADHKEKFNNVAVSELPAIKGSKRHSAWQNMKKYRFWFIFRKKHKPLAKRTESRINNLHFLHFIEADSQMSTINKRWKTWKLSYLWENRFGAACRVLLIQATRRVIINRFRGDYPL